MGSVRLPVPVTKCFQVAHLATPGHQRYRTGKPLIIHIALNDIAEALQPLRGHSNFLRLDE
jgi:hypothetical protein